MQLKTSRRNPSNFNINKITAILMNENKFINDLFDKISLPAQKEEEVEITTNSHNLKRKFLNVNANGQPSARAKSLEELQNRLEALKVKRGLNYREKLNKRALKTHIKKKLKKDERKLSKSVIVPKAGQTTLETEEEIEKEHVMKSSKPVFNSQGKMVFSKFDFSDLNDKKSRKRGPTDPAKILEKLNKNREKLKSLKDEGEIERAEELKEKFAWKSALAKAEGQKVKDDPHLLKKSVKKQEQIKRSSAKKWEARKEGVKKAQDGRQRKREENINKRKVDKKNKKMKKAVKKGRIIPGF